MNIRILLVLFLLFLLKFDILDSTHQTKKGNKFWEPCFEEEENFAHCSSSDKTCAKDDHFKLVRLPGMRTGHVSWLELEKGRKYKLITRAMRPLLFEIPSFLSDEECDHIISLAKKIGLYPSVISRDQFRKEELEKAMQEADSNATLDAKDSVAQDFNTWDIDKDGFIDNLEVNSSFNGFVLSANPKFNVINNFQMSLSLGKVSSTLFRQWNLKKALSYMAYLKKSSAQHSFRFSDQAWLRQDRTADHVLRRLHERIIKLTKLPRKIIQGSEDMQVVRYQAFGHYHAHFDSGLELNTPCCHQNPSLRPPQCRICRFITILYYLNDVEQGGETAFPVADNFTVKWKDLENAEAVEYNLSINCHAANLVIPPKKGTAIMWYNNFIDADSGLLGKLDRNSLHGGCDVIKGEKWIANNWLTAPTENSKYLKSSYDVGFSD
ncbi:unnamed protein product [Porites lobata]|uniref:Transmembrane prolyl 4-hydroxylase n=1 Tax=Porites lobata TaxID=104759 RepID=A0ABN8RHM8_9CNID|nr:unnamed protein product [Porites lobata]